MRADAHTRKSTLLLAATELFVATDSPTRVERNVYGELFRQYIDTTPVAERRQIATLLSRCPAAPHDCVLTLAQDGDASVAHRVLAYSLVLSDCDLIAAIGRGPRAVRRAISLRHEISDPVREALRRHANDPEPSALVEDDAAPVAPPAFGRRQADAPPHSLYRPMAEPPAAADDDEPARSKPAPSPTPVAQADPSPAPATRSAQHAEPVGADLAAAPATAEQAEEAPPVTACAAPSAPVPACAAPSAPAPASLSRSASISADSLPHASTPDTAAPDAAEPDTAAPAPAAPVSAPAAAPALEAFLRETPDARAMRIATAQARVLAETAAAGYRARPKVDPVLVRCFEQAALARDAETLRRLMAETLQLPAHMVERILADPHGEPLVVACAALGLPTSRTVSLMLQISPAAHSLEALRTLSALRANLDLRVARRLVADWTGRATTSPRHQPQLQDAMRPQRAPIARQERTENTIDSAGILVLRDAV